MATVHPKAPLLDQFRGRSKRACSGRAWLAEQTETDVDTVVRWTKGEEAVPDEVIDWLAGWSGFSVVYAMGWTEVPRGEILER